MALKKSRPTKFGVPAEYWKVTQTVINWHLERATIELQGFLNDQARRDGTASLGNRVVHIVPGHGDEWPFNPAGNVVQASYHHIKRVLAEEFGDAEDV